MTAAVPARPAADIPRRFGAVSFWHDRLGGLPSPRPALEGDTTADVAIVGAGYTGLWAAYYLKQAAPALSVLVIESRVAGYGASGRNGGWLTGGFSWNHRRYLSTGDAEGIRAMVAVMGGTVAEVIRVAAAEGIEADIHPTDELTVATCPAQMHRLRAELEERRHWGEAEDRLYPIDARQTRDRIDVPGALGALVTAGVARIQPAMLVRGLAAAVERQGVRIVEGTTARTILPGRVETDRGTVRAPVILRATEGFTAALRGHRRDWLPLNSAQIVTDPLPPALWDRIGWSGAELLGDFANAYCYCQRTADGRIALGGRGMPYRWGSRIDRDGRPDAATLRWLATRFRALFPAAAEVPLAHGWCGVLAVPRDWCATVGFDRATGLGWAGGYVGVGVSTANLAGRTLADLVTGADSDLVRLPWVNRRVRRWEPEPVRWLGVRGMYALLAAADRRETQGRAYPSRLAALGRRLAGR